MIAKGCGRTPAKLQRGVITRGCLTGGAPTREFVNVVAGDWGAAAGIVGASSHTPIVEVSVPVSAVNPEKKGMVFARGAAAAGTSGIGAARLGRPAAVMGRSSACCG